MRFNEKELKKIYAVRSCLGDFLFNTVVFDQDDDDEILAVVDWWKKHHVKKKYTVQVARGNLNSFLNIFEDGDAFFDDDEEWSNCQTHFTQAEIEKLKQRDDIAIDWNKAIIKLVEDD